MDVPLYIFSSFNFQRLFDQIPLPPPELPWLYPVRMAARSREAVGRGVMPKAEQRLSNLIVALHHVH